MWLSQRDILSLHAGVSYCISYQPALQTSPSPSILKCHGVCWLVEFVSCSNLAGMSSTDFVIPINKDPDAPIFGVADFSIVGDLFDVMPHVIDEVERIQSER